MGKTGKPRITNTTMYVCPIVYKELIAKDFYEGCTYILTKDAQVNVLEMTNYDFLCWAYACLVRIGTYGISRVWPSPNNKLFRNITNICTQYGSQDPYYIKTIVGSTQSRLAFLDRLRLLENFVRVPIIRERSFEHIQHCLLKHKSHFLDNGVFPELLKKTEELMDYNTQVDKNKLLNELTLEVKDVLHEYENSGYWD